MSGVFQASDAGLDDEPFTARGAFRADCISMRATDGFEHHPLKLKQGDCRGDLILVCQSDTPY